jgi:hypothetical protein
VLGGSVAPDAGDLGPNPVPEAVAQRSIPLGPRGKLGPRQLAGHAEADDARHVLRAASPPSLLASTSQQRLECAVSAHHEATGALRPVHLVGGGGEEVRRHLAKIRRMLAEHLGGVDV